MTHTAGFEDHVLGLFSESGVSMRPMVELMQTQMPRRVFPPGQIAAYSNYGTTLAALIVEQVSGIPYERYLADKILKPPRSGASAHPHLMVAWNTVADWQEKAAAFCRRFSDRKIAGIAITEPRADEIRTRGPDAGHAGWIDKQAADVQGEFLSNNTFWGAAKCHVRVLRFRLVSQRGRFAPC